MFGSTTPSRFKGGDGNDTLIAGAGVETFIGDAGTDFVYYYDSTAGVSVDLKTGVSSGGYAEGDQLSGIEGLAAATSTTRWRAAMRPSRSTAATATT